MPKFIVTTDKTTFYSIEIEADSEEKAIEKAQSTPIENWDENNTEFSQIYEVQ